MRVDADDNVIWDMKVENLAARLAIEHRDLKVIDKQNSTLWPNAN